MKTLNDSSEKKTLKKKFPSFQTLSRYFSKFNLSNIGGFSHFEILSEGQKPSSKRERKISRREFTSSKKNRGINGIGKFYKVALLFIKIIYSLYC